jgi:hypothetical protein
MKNKRLKPKFSSGGILTDSIEASVSGNEYVLPTRTDFILPTKIKIKL